MADQLEEGLVVSVAEVLAGDELLAATPAGATTLVLGDAVAFYEDGGEALVLGETLAYTSADLDTDTLHLAAPTTVAYEEGEQVLVLPAAVERVASVALDTDGESVEARIPHALYDRIPEGVRDPGAEERVSVSLDGGEWVVADVLGREPLVDGTYLDPATVPTTDTGPTAPPASSPLLTVTGVTNGLVVRADEVEPDSLVAYHITATPPTDVDGEVLPFTPTADTLLGAPTRSTVLVVTELPDGTALQPEVTYYLRAVASNELGEAAPGPQATGQLDLSVVSEQIAATVTAGFLLAGSIQVGQITIDPNTGITIPTTGGGITLPADGSAATFSGHVNASSVQVEDLLIINGEQNRINGQLLLGNVVEAPKSAPTVGWQFPGEVNLGDASWSLCDSPAGTEWVTVNYSTWEIKAYSKATGALVKTVAPNSGATATHYPVGITRVGNRYYVATEKNTDEFATYVLVLEADWTKVREFGRVTTANNVPSRLAVGHDNAGNVLVAWMRSGGDTRVNRYGLAGAYIDTTWLNTSDLVGGNPTTLSHIHQLPTGSGGALEWWVTIGGGSLYRSADTSITSTKKVTTPEWVKGLHWDGTRHWTMGYTSYRIWKWSTNQWPAAVSARYSWYDDDPAGTGVHETQAGPSVSFQPYPFSYLRVSTPPPPDNGLPDAPNAVRLYLDEKLHTNGTPYGDYLLWEGINATGNAPPTVNGFEGASATPGTLTSADGTIINLNGDGSGRVGPYQWDASGAATDGLVAGLDQRLDFLETVGPWQVIGNTGNPGFQNGFTEFSTDSAKYRLNAAGDMVTVTADLNIPGNVTQGDTMFTLPAGYRPSVAINNMFGWQNSSGVKFCLINVSPAGAVTWWTGGNAAGTRTVFTVHIPIAT